MNQKTFAEALHNLQVFLVGREEEVKSVLTEVNAKCHASLLLILKDGSDHTFSWSLFPDYSYGPDNDNDKMEAEDLYRFFKLFTQLPESLTILKSFDPITRRVGITLVSHPNKRIHVLRTPLTKFKEGLKEKERNHFLSFLEGREPQKALAQKFWQPELLVTLKPWQDQLTDLPEFETQASM